ncbi:uncharacterized protein DEA37_0002953 [Paragonimus westermani]|uniref:Uncharacterized protein n=1 Tax=Paragonimus westermani TaxID=34504 RepID=A0A5J4NVP1_9TREM|nr:uncharacterized protein DEA37_0002953 [Paragonimus westermani]
MLLRLSLLFVVLSLAFGAQLVQCVEDSIRSTVYPRYEPYGYADNDYKSRQWPTYKQIKKGPIKYVFVHEVEPVPIKYDKYRNDYDYGYGNRIHWKPERRIELTLVTRLIERIPFPVYSNKLPYSWYSLRTQKPDRHIRYIPYSDRPRWIDRYSPNERGYSPARLSTSYPDYGRQFRYPPSMYL